MYVCIIEFLIDYVFVSFPDPAEIAFFKETDEDTGRPLNILTGESTLENGYFDYSTIDDMGSKKKVAMMDKSSTEYREKREKNNNAVKRSRDKSKAKAVEAQMRVHKLQTENECLRLTVDNMTTELKYLKEMLISQAGQLKLILMFVNVFKVV